MSFELKIENFEGPIDLLLQLIEKRKIPINDISLSKIADDYIKYIESFDKKHLFQITHFILVASTLTLIKSKSLLPNLELTEDEENDIDELKKRIKILKAFQEASLSLKKEISIQKKFSVPRARKAELRFQPYEGLKKIDFIEILNAIFAGTPQRETKKKEAYIKINVHIENIMSSLEQRIQKVMKFSFQSFVEEQLPHEKNTKTVKVYNVVSFLALLELVKNGAMQVLQKNNFEDISIHQGNDEKPSIVVN